MFRAILRKKERERILKLAQGVEMVFVRVPAGEFLMGSTDDDIEQLVQAARPEDKRMRMLWAEEMPQHTVFLPEYWVGKTPVTTAQFEVFTKATGYQTTAETGNDECTWKHPKGLKARDGLDIIYIPDSGDGPVCFLSWHDAVAFCEWASKATGMQTRLPSEAEWEKAARGTDGRLYPWGNDWNSAKACTHEGRKTGVSSVGCYPRGASPYGALDMAGNVREMTRSLDRPYPYNPEDGRENMTSPETECRMSRGGSWWDDKVGARCADRNRYRLHEASDQLGFRCLLSMST